MCCRQHVTSADSAPLRRPGNVCSRHQCWESGLRRADCPHRSTSAPGIDAEQPERHVCAAPSSPHPHKQRKNAPPLLELMRCEAFFSSCPNVTAKTRSPRLFSLGHRGTLSASRVSATQRSKRELQPRSSELISGLYAVYIVSL